MPQLLQVITTTSTKEDAQRIATGVVDQRLAACVHLIGPIESVYRWEGKVETSAEWLCLMKTTEECYPRIEQAIVALHPYDTPEILATPIVAGHADYLAWAHGELDASPK